MLKLFFFFVVCSDDFFFDSFLLYYCSQTGISKGTILRMGKGFTLTGIDGQDLATLFLEAFKRKVLKKQVFIFFAVFFASPLYIYANKFLNIIIDTILYYYYYYYYRTFV